MCVVCMEIGAVRKKQKEIYAKVAILEKSHSKSFSVLGRKILVFKINRLLDKVMPLDFKFGNLPRKRKRKKVKRSVKSRVRKRATRSLRKKVKGKVKSR